MITRRTPLEGGALFFNSKTNLAIFKFTIVCFLASAFSCLISEGQAASTVIAWGDNSHTQTNVLANLTNVTAVAGGTFHSLALTNAGTVVGWGESSSGETQPPVGLSGVEAIAAGNGFSLSLQNDGSVKSWGNQSTVPAALTNVVAIAAAADNALGLRADGVAIPWGAVSAVPADVTNVVSIAAGYTHDLALKGDGTVAAWGDDSLGKTSVPADLTNAISLAAGRFHSLALRSDGTVAAWGDNTYDQLEIPPGLSNVVAISAGGVHSLALKNDGTVVAWGNDAYKQLAIPNNLAGVVGIAAGRYHNLAIVGDGSPSITVQPVSRYNPSTQEAVFQVMAAGQLPLSYQWLKDGTNIEGATNSTLVMMGLPTSEAGTYSVMVSNSLGFVSSIGAALPPAWQRPIILSQPLSADVFCNDDATFHVVAGGAKPHFYQWYFEGAPIEGATNRVLIVDHVHADAAGAYQVVVSNVNGSMTSQAAALTVLAEEPLITSPLMAPAKQGVAFNYTITALHDPTSFSAIGLPVGLAINPTNGVIQGTPVDAGMFTVTLGTANLCASTATNLTLIVTSSAPAIISALTAVGVEQASFNYQITATESPTGFGAQNLPQGLHLNPATGIISGSPLYAGKFISTISASNAWGVGTATPVLTISNAPITGLAIENVATVYSSPYLLDFQFALRDNDDPTQSHAVVVDPRLLTVTGLEDDVNPTEIEEIIQRANAKVLKAYLVLDFTRSVASLASGDTNNDGISDAVDTEVRGAQEFVNQQPADAQIGVYEFHREDLDPQQVASLTTDKKLVNEAISGIWTNYVHNFPAGSRCWDAVVSAIGGLGVSNSDEQHYVILVSDGRDESSTSTIDDVITAATNNNVHVYCVGFGADLDATTLQLISDQTSGRYYEATNASDLSADFAQIGKDLNGQYILRWATLKRSSSTFMPSFRINYQGFTAMSPPNPPPFVSGTNEVVDTSTEPPTTNYVLVYTTNYLIAPYAPMDYAGSVLVGSLRLAADADVHPSGVALRATYIPRYIRQIRLHYRANWPCSLSLQSTNLGEMLYGWSLTETNDQEGGTWALLSSPNPQSLPTSIPFASFGKLLTFSFRDIVNASNAFSIFEVDNSTYTNNGGQSFVFENANSFIMAFPELPHGTPIPWLLVNGFTNNFETAELSDPDGDGALTWQEYQANTDPNDSGSQFRLSNVGQTDAYGRYQITFTTALNRKYRLQSSSDLVTWHTLVQDITGTGNQITITDIRNPSDSAQSYYRVLVY